MNAHMPMTYYSLPLARFTPCTMAGHKISCIVSILGLLCCTSTYRQSQMPVCLLQTWTQTTTYLQLVGILLGQVFFGVMGDAVGRRAAMLTDMVRCLWEGHALVCHAIEVLLGELQ